eukprot:7448410-Karenia_brevis.AAC.1
MDPNCEFCRAGKFSVLNAVEVIKRVMENLIRCPSRDSSATLLPEITRFHVTTNFQDMATL